MTHLNDADEGTMHCAGEGPQGSRPVRSLVPFGTDGCIHGGGPVVAPAAHALRPCSGKPALAIMCDRDFCMYVTMLVMVCEPSIMCVSALNQQQRRACSVSDAYRT